MLVFLTNTNLGVPMSEEVSIRVWTEEVADTGRKAALPTLGRAAANAVARSIEVSKDALLTNIESFAAQFAPLVEGNPIADTNVVIDEIELLLIISASGGVELLGKLSAGAQAGIKVKLKRK